MSTYLEALREQCNNTPFWRLLHMRVGQVDEGKAIVELDLSEEFCNLNSAIHGGVLLSLLDSVMGVTVRSILQTPIVTQSITSQFLRAPSNTETISAQGDIVRLGGRVVSVQGRVYDSFDNMLAIGLAAYMVLEKR